MARSSEVAKARFKANNALKALEEDKPRKPGNPGDFHRRCAEHINEYLLLGVKECEFHAIFWAAFVAGRHFTGQYRSPKRFHCLILRPTPPWVPLSPRSRTRTSSG